jgi:predicted HAD superfamily phosphohydrolase YqeG
LDITSILVNPLTSKDYYVTIFYRIIEKFIFNKLNKRDLFLKGKYYE